MLDYEIQRYRTAMMSLIEEKAKLIKERNRESCKFKIKKVIFNNPVTIVFWQDGTKTIVKCQDGDTYNKEAGLALCFAKKTLGNKGNFNETFKKWCE